MGPEHIPQLLHIVRLPDRADMQAALVHAGVEIVRLIQYIDHAAGHPGGKVFAGLSQNEHPAARHVLAAVVAHALHNGGRAGVSHAEALARDAGNERRTRGRAVERDVSDDDVFIRREC